VRHLIRPHLSCANVISTLAVFFVLAGGTALALALPKNSVGSATVKNGSLRSADLADGSLSGADVADGSLAGADLAGGSIGGADLAPGAIGQQALAPDAVSSSKVLDKSLRGVDFGDRALVGENVAIASLGKVPQARTLHFRPPSLFLSTDFYERGTPLQFGTELADGTWEQTAQCENPADHLISGGANSTGPDVQVYESVPFGDPAQGRADIGWKVRVGPGAGLWSVHIVCARALSP
jgi:hypothetical protein